MKNFKKLSLACLLLTGIVFSADAQNRKKKKKDEGEMKVIIVNSENGKITKTEETYSLKDKEKVQKMLKEKGIDLEFDNGYEYGVKVSTDGGKDIDRKVIIKTDGEGGKHFVTEEHVKIVTVKDGETIHGDEDVKVTVEELKGGNGKKISITSVGDGFEDHEIIVETLGDVMEVGKAMIFVRKNSNEVKSDLPKSINEIFDGEASIKDLNLFPNPTNGNFKMKFTSERPDDFQLDITDAKGAKVYERSLKNFEGEFNEDFDLSQYDAGIYFFNLTSKEQTLSKKIIVQ